MVAEWKVCFGVEISFFDRFFLKAIKRKKFLFITVRSNVQKTTTVPGHQDKQEYYNGGNGEGVVVGCSDERYVGWFGWRNYNLTRL